MGMNNIIYKIEDAKVWTDAQALGHYAGSPLDLADGFIHMSTSAQVRETAGKWFAGKADLVLVGVDSDALAGALKWEVSRDGALFPHIYAALPMNAVLCVTPMPLGETGLHIFGPEIA